MAVPGSSCLKQAHNLCLAPTPRHKQRLYNNMSAPIQPYVRSSHIIAATSAQHLKQHTLQAGGELDDSFTGLDVRQSTHTTVSGVSHARTGQDRDYGCLLRQGPV